MYFLMDDPGFWDHGPRDSADARELAAAVGIRLRHFVMAGGASPPSAPPPDSAPALDSAPDGAPDLDSAPDSAPDPGGASAPPVAALMYQPPGHRMPRHSHASFRLEFIVNGSLESDGKTLGPGDVMATAPGEMYGPHVAGPDGVLTVEVFSSALGIGGQMEDPALDARTVLSQLAERGLTATGRRELIDSYAARMRGSQRPSAG